VNLLGVGVEKGVDGEFIGDFARATDEDLHFHGVVFEVAADDGHLVHGVSSGGEVGVRSSEFG